MQVGGEEALAFVEHRPARASHRGVEEGRHHPAVHDESAAAVVEAEVRRRFPLDHRSTVALLDAVIRERAPDVRRRRRLVAPVRELIGRSRPMSGRGLVRGNRESPAQSKRSWGFPGSRGERHQRGPGMPGSGTEHAVRLHDPRATALRVVHDRQRRLGDERRLHQRHGEHAAELVLDDRRVGEPGAERVDANAVRAHPFGSAAHETDDGVLRRGVHGVEGHSRQTRERRGADDGAAVRHQPVCALARAVDDAKEVRADDPLDLRVRQLGHVGVSDADSGVEEGCVELALERAPRGHVDDVELGKVEGDDVPAGRARPRSRGRCRPRRL